MVHSQLRPGDTGSATGAVAFLRQSVARLPSSRRRTVLIRADREFDVEALYARCERRRWHYVIKLRVTADLASRIWTHAAHGRWRVVDAEAVTPIEVAELRFRRGCWSRVRRVVLTRRRDAENPQGHLWDAAGYNDAAYVTDVAETHDRGPPPSERPRGKLMPRLPLLVLQDLALARRAQPTSRERTPR